MIASLALTSLTACIHPPPDARPAVYIVDGSRPETPITGARLVSLAGGALARPVTVPLWLSVPPPGDDRVWDVHVHWIELANGDLYVDQRSVELGVACKLLHQGRFRDSPCLETEFYTIQLEPVSPGLVVARESAEGCGAFEIFGWDAAGQRKLLSKSLGCAGGELQWHAEGAELVLRSNCDLSGDGCPAMSNEAEHKTWRWSEAGGLRGP